MDGVEDLLVPRAAAEVSGQRLADLVVGRIGNPAEELGRRDDESRSAEAALDGTRVGERLLHGVELSVLAQILDGDDLVAVGLGGEDEAGTDQCLVKKDRARAALPLLTRVLRAGQVEPIAECRQQAFPRPDVRFPPLPVDCYRDLQARHLSSARPVSTRRAWRR